MDGGVQATEMSKEEEDRQPFQMTAVMKRPSFENDLTSRQEDNSLSEDLRTLFVLGSGRRQDRHLDYYYYYIIIINV